MPRRTDTLTVEEVQARFEAWRQKRQGRTAIPDELWSAASQLARRHGVNRITQLGDLYLNGGTTAFQVSQRVGHEQSPLT